MRMRGKQPCALNRLLLFIIEEPILAGLEAGDDRVSGCGRMFGRVLARRTVTTSDVPALRTPTEMKPPTVRRGQTFCASVATGFRSGVDSAQSLFHFRPSFARFVRKEYKSGLKEWVLSTFILPPEDDRAFHATSGSSWSAARRATS